MPALSESDVSEQKTRFKRVNISRFKPQTFFFSGKKDFLYFVITGSLEAFKKTMGLVYNQSRGGMESEIPSTTYTGDKIIFVNNKTINKTYKA